MAIKNNHNCTECRTSIVGLICEFESWKLNGFSFSVSQFIIIYCMIGARAVPSKKAKYTKFMDSRVKCTNWNPFNCSKWCIEWILLLLPISRALTLHPHRRNQSKWSGDRQAIEWSSKRKMARSEKTLRFTWPSWSGTTVSNIRTYLVHEIVAAVTCLRAQSVCTLIAAL